MLNINFYQFVDCSGRHETPAGAARLRETPQELAPRRLPDRPRKANAWNGNQQPS
ncbi:hypothetical protein JOC75_003870 [Metabacillus crassostreae]|nr:hypothetical protein [Metabacillus crassostreae]